MGVPDLGRHAPGEGGERWEGRPGFLGPGVLTVLCAPPSGDNQQSVLHTTKGEN